MDFIRNHHDKFVFRVIFFDTPLITVDLGGVIFIRSPRTRDSFV